MKRIVTIILAAVMIFSLVACGTNQSEKKPVSDSITGATSKADDTEMNGTDTRSTITELEPNAVVSARRVGTTATWDQVNKYFALMQMPIISSRYWPIVHGATPEQVKKDLEGMQAMRILGKNMAFFLKCKEAGLKAGIAMPEQEPVTFTNFIRE